MAKESQALLALNRGIVSPLALARIDVKRIAMAAEVQTNWMPRVLGSAMLRPGLAYLGSTRNNQPSKFIEFVKNTVDSVDLLEISSQGQMRVWQNDALVTFGAVGTTVQDVNALFTGWANNSEAGASVTYDAFSGYYKFQSNGFAGAIIDQLVTVAPADRNKEHAIFFVIGAFGVWNAAEITLRIGVSSSDDSYIRETTLGPGDHILSFTPTGNFNIRLLTTFSGTIWVGRCFLYNPTAVTLEVPTPWGVNDLDLLRWEQSADFVYVACRSFQPRVIQHRSQHSWSVVHYFTPDGPFMPENVTQTTITASDLFGDITLTASRPIFHAPDATKNEGGGNVGGVFRINSQGQLVKGTLTGSNQWTDYIKISGLGPARAFSYTVTGLTGTGTKVTLQRSFGVPGIWVASDGWPTTVDQNTPAANDNLDNQIVYYRFAIEAGNYVAGSIACVLNFGSDSISGTALITGYISPTSVNATVIKHLGGIKPVTTWFEGQWSDQEGWPTAVVLYEGRLWWAGNNGIFASVSDAFNSFDPTVVGDAGPIQRTIGSGPVDRVNWIMPLQRLLAGTQGAEHSIRASALDDVVTPTNFNIKTVSTQGSNSLPGLKVDQRGFFVNRTGYRLYVLEFGFQFYDYSAKDVTALCPSLLKPGVVRMAVQRQPDTRLHLVRSDGVVVVCVEDPVEEVNAFVTVQTDGFVEDVAVLPAAPGKLDDQIYYVVRRTIAGQTVRYLEKWAQEDECRGDAALCKLADAHIVYSGAPVAIIPGLSALEGKQVVVWADGADVGTDDTVTPWVQRYTVTGGQIILAAAASNVVVGLPYTAQFKSTKLGLASQDTPVPLNAQKRIDHIGVVLADAHPLGLQFGPDFANLDNMPLVEAGTTVGTATEAAYDENVIEFPGTWTTDLRLCLQANAPRPCTLLGVRVDLRTHK